jgi:hypothetical protein
MSWMRRLRAWATQSAFRFILVFGLLVGGYLFLWTSAFWLLLFPLTGGIDILLLAELSALVGLILSAATWVLLQWQRRRSVNLQVTDARIYGQHLGWRIVAIAIATVAGCCGLWLLHWSFYADYMNSKLAVGWAMSTLGSLYIAFGAVMAIAMTTLKAVYGPEGVEVRCAIPFPGWNGLMLRDDIAAKANISINVLMLMPTYVLYPKEWNKKKLTIWVPKEDDYFRNWIAGIPNADRQFIRNRRKSGPKP